MSPRATRSRWRGDRRRLGRDAVSIPNLITYARILAIPVVLFALSVPNRRSAFTAALCFGLASLTDALDGYLARRFNLTSMIGKFLDPLADKLLVMGTLVTLVHLDRVAPWVVVLLLAREIIINTLRTIAASEGMVIAARELGKHKTAFQMIGIFCLLVHYTYTLPLLPSPVDFHSLGLHLLYISLVFSLGSALDYFRSFFRAVLEESEAGVDR